MPSSSGVAGAVFAAATTAFAVLPAAAVYQCTVNATLGCYIDPNDNRVLPFAATMVDPTLTLESCAALCAGAGYAGGINGVE